MILNEDLYDFSNVEEWFTKSEFVNNMYATQLAPIEGGRDAYFKYIMSVGLKWQQDNAISNADGVDSSKFHIDFNRETPLDLGDSLKMLSASSCEEDK